MNSNMACRQAGTSVQLRWLAVELLCEMRLNVVCRKGFGSVLPHIGIRVTRVVFENLITMVIMSGMATVFFLSFWRVRITPARSADRSYGGHSIDASSQPRARSCTVVRDLSAPSVLEPK